MTKKPQNLLTWTTTVTSYGNIYLVTLAPACLQSVTAFAHMAAQTIVRPLMHWPNPELLPEVCG